MIDHTCLSPESGPEQIEKACQEALQFHFAAVCVSSLYIERVAQRLAGAPCLPIAVVGFPLGSESSAVKAFEAEFCRKAGAQEIDMVLHIGLLKAGLRKEVQADIAAVVRAAEGIPVKVILETSELEPHEIRLGCELSRDAGASFVKTSTGFASGGATPEAVQLMSKAVGATLGVKASGGIRDVGSAMNMIRAGANRIGTSHGVRIVAGQSGVGGY